MGIKSEVAEVYRLTKLPDKESSIMNELQEIKKELRQMKQLIAQLYVPRV